MKSLKNQVTEFADLYLLIDNDHILGIEELDKKWSITNFYAVENNIPADKNDPSLSKYIELKKTKNFPINKGIKELG